jgi:hypothetical protein
MEGERDVSELQKKYKFYTVSENPADKDGFIWDLMVFGLECPNAWYEPLDKLGQKIEEARKAGLIDAETRASQVKEKWYELRVYYYPYNDLVEQYIEEAEKEVAEIEAKILGER